MKEEIIITDPEQIRAIGSPIGNEIINRLRSDGPKSASEIAAMLGTSAPGVTYHLKRMAGLGLLNVIGPRGKNGVLYEAAAHRFFVDYRVPNQDELMKATHEAARKLWKRSWDDYEKAASRNSVEVLSTMMFSRFEGEFTKEQSARLWELVKEIGNMFAETRNQKSEGAKRISLTLSVSPRD
ncbi:MAG: helix-turn-helix transcriptional regulator [Armatimonadetes bacterium]|nr:helix-turn-helix transcriptional regulator [Armatimonadota bacterium]